MATIAEALGIAWDTPAATQEVYRLGAHAERQIAAKGFDRAAVLDAANNPAHTYANGRYEGQMRHIKGRICAVVDPARREVVTVYVNVEQTALRADQTDTDARAYGRRLAAAGRR